MPGFKKHCWAGGVKLCPSITANLCETGEHHFEVSHQHRICFPGPQGVRHTLKRDLEVPSVSLFQLLGTTKRLLLAERISRDSSEYLLLAAGERKEFGETSLCGVPLI